MNRAPARCDLLACNLVLASIAALLMATVGSSVTVVQILRGGTVAVFDIDLRYNHTIGSRGRITVYPQQYQDLLDFIDRNPQYLHDLRARLLSPELIALPEQFAELVGVVAELSANFQAFAEATDRRLTAVETDIGTLKTDVSTLKTDVATLKTDVATLKTDVATLKTDVVTLKTDVVTLKTDVVTLKTDVGTLMGNDIERRARENILNIARDELDLTRGRILLARGRESEPRFLETIEAAEERGLITEREADNVLVADIIIRARRTGDRQYVYGVFEVSRTIRIGDIQRAHDRASAVSKATGEDTVAAVIGGAVASQQRAQAEERDVRVLTPPMFQRPEPEENSPDRVC